MNKQSIVEIVAGNVGVSQREAGLIIDELLNTVADALANGEKVNFVGFGSFEVKQRQAHMGINPTTKERIRIEASNVPTFRAGKILKRKVNQ